MACCAFALFVIGQIAAFFLAMRRALGLSGATDRVPPVNPATAWKLHATSVGPLAPPPVRRNRRHTLLASIVVLEIGLVAMGATWAHDHLRSASPGGFASLVETAWCGTAPPSLEAVGSRD